MEKDKKQIEGNLLGRSILYILLMTCALGLVAYLVQYGFFYLNIISFQRGDDSSPIIATLLPFIIFAFLMALLVTRITWGKGKTLWNQWQRQWAIDAEEERVLRLMDESAHDDSQEIESSENIQQYKR